MADKDGNLIADKDEFTAFLHPEEYEYMKDIVVMVWLFFFFCFVSLFFHLFGQG